MTRKEKYESEYVWEKRKKETMKDRKRWLARKMKKMKICEKERRKVRCYKEILGV